MRRYTDTAYGWALEDTTSFVKVIADRFRAVALRSIEAGMKSRTAASAVGFGFVAAGLLATVGSRPLPGMWSSPASEFWFVTVAAGLCLPLAVAVLVVGWRQATAELAIVGSTLTVLSAWSVVHGLTIPGYLYGPNGVTDVASLLALPAALAVAAPICLGDRGVARLLVGRWRLWCLGWVVATAGATAIVLARAATVKTSPGTGALEAVSAIVAVVGVVALAGRHLRLYVIGRRRASLVASASVAYLGIAGLLGLVAAPASAAWWVAHALDAGAVLVAAVAALVAYRSDASIAAIVAPVVNHDPLAALELGLSPEVHAFVAALERKDAITRDHVVRVGELAMRVGVRAGLAPSRLRAVGLAALLHDIGKLVIPSEIIGKPGALTDAEFAVIKTHSEQGAALLEQSVALRPVAPLVRAHHERPDGRGYPDRLRGEELSLEMAIVSACDGAPWTPRSRSPRSCRRQLAPNSRCTDDIRAVRRPSTPLNKIDMTPSRWPALAFIDPM